MCGRAWRCVCVCAVCGCVRNRGEPTPALPGVGSGGGGVGLIDGEGTETRDKKGEVNRERLEFSCSFFFQAQQVGLPPS